MNLRIATTPADRLKCICIRAIVFMHEQHCPYAEEIDGLDEGALHVLGEVETAHGPENINTEPVATARIRFLGEPATDDSAGGWAKLERIAIREAWRGGGHGHELVEFLVETARSRGYTRLKMHAQSHLVEFYERHGFVARGEEFVEAGILHRVMVREG